MTMKWHKGYDFIGAYLMLVLVLLWSSRLDLGAILDHAQARKAELDAQCKKGTSRA